MQSSDLEANLGVESSSQEEEENPILDYIHQFQQESLAEARASPDKMQEQFEENQRGSGIWNPQQQVDIPEQEEVLGGMTICLPVSLPMQPLLA